MILVRVWACKGLADRGFAGLLDPKLISEGHELAHLSLDLIMDFKGWELKCGLIEERGLIQDKPRPLTWTIKMPRIRVGVSSRAATKSSDVAIQVQARLQDIVSSFKLPRYYNWPWPHPDEVPAISSPWPDENGVLTEQLSSAITSVLELTLNSRHVTFSTSWDTATGHKEISWANEILVETTEDPTGFLDPGRLQFEVSINNSNQALLDKARLSAVLSLWLYTIAKRREGRKVDTSYHYRLLGGHVDREDFGDRDFKVYKDWLGQTTSDSGYHLFSLLPDSPGGMRLRIHQEDTPPAGYGMYPVFGLCLSLKMA